MNARYEPPTVAKLPVYQGWSRIQATTSWPSSTSLTMGRNSPPEPKVPRHETNSAL